MRCWKGARQAWSLECEYGVEVMAGLQLGMRSWDWRGGGGCLFLLLGGLGVGGIHVLYFGLGHLALVYHPLKRKN